MTLKSKIKPSPSLGSYSADLPRFLLSDIDFNSRNWNNWNSTFKYSALKKI